MTPIAIGLGLGLAAALALSSVMARSSFSPAHRPRHPCRRRDWVHAGRPGRGLAPRHDGHPVDRVGSRHHQPQELFPQPVQREPAVTYMPEAGRGLGWKGGR
jgi:hypothetical protein